MKPAVARLIRPAAPQRGLALVCALLLVLVASVLAVSAGRMALASLAAAGQERDRVVARAAAEAALGDAERDIGGAQAGRAARFEPADGAAFAEGCGQGGFDQGLCRATEPPAWQTIDLAAPGQSALVPYGRFTGARMAVGGALLPARLPAYLIERLDVDASARDQGQFFRITAIGFGTRVSTQVVLQALYHQPGAGPPGLSPVTTAARLPAGRIGWREIANWPELHAQARR